MLKNILFLLIISNCNSYTIEKTIIPKPILNNIEITFKSVKIINKDNLIYLNKENFLNLIYNIKMARIYYNQEAMNREILENYYIQIIKDLNGELIESNTKL